MKLLLLAGLCAIAVARLPNSNWEQEHFPECNADCFKAPHFKAGKEYKFKYNGQLASGIPGTSRQHSATRIQALVALNFKDENTCVMEIEKVRVGRLNQRIPNPRAMIPFMLFEEVEIANDLEKKLTAPIKFEYNQGLISEVQFDHREEAWSANIKRGILNMLQVNLKKQAITSQSEIARLPNRAEQPNTPELDYYTVTEPTLEGLCETHYTVTSQPRYQGQEQNVLNVTKSIDFEKCQRRPEIKYNWRFEDPCPTCQPKFKEDQKFLKASTLAKYNISGTPEQFLIESAIVESQYNFVPFNREANMMTTYVNQTLVLIRSGRPQGQVRGPKQPQDSDSDMIYSPEWDMQKEELFMNGDGQFLEQTPFSELKNKVKFVQSILRRLVEQMNGNVQEEAPRQYLRLVKIFRMLKSNELQQIHQKLYQKSGPFTPEQHKKIKELIVDAIADAGTKDAVSHLVEKIQNKQIGALRASISIKQLINSRVISQKMIQELMNLAESQICQRNWFLKQSAYLTMGSMINALCKPNSDRLAQEFKLRPQQYCPQSYQQELVQKMFSKLNSAQSYGDKIVYLKTIANMGLDSSVFELEKIIKNVESQEPVSVRIEAVLALRQIRHTLPKKVQQICMPIYMNRRMPTELRIVCAHQILATQPGRPVLDQMARKLFTERNRQVASFVYSQMLTLANSTQPCEQKLASDLKLSLRHGKQIAHAYYPSYSKVLGVSGYSQRYRIGGAVRVTSVMSERSRLPHVLVGSLDTSFLGMWQKYLIKVGVVASNTDSLLQQYLGSKGYWNEMELGEILVRARRSAQASSPKQELKNLWTKLKTVQRNLASNPEGYVFLRFKDQDFGILPFNLETMTQTFSEFISEGKINLRQIENFLESGYNFHLYKAAILHEMSYKIPTTLGMPLVLSVKIPTVMQLTGQVKAKMQNRWRKSQIELNDIKPSMVTAAVADIQVWSPITNSGLKVVGLSKVYAPIDGSVKMDLTQSPPSFVAKYNLPKRAVQWLHLETRPVTYTRVWPKFLESWQEPEECTVHGEQWTRQYNFENDLPIVRRFEQFCEQSLGVQVNLRGFWHHTPAMRVQGTPFCPLSGVNKFFVQTKPTSQQPKTIVAKLTGSIFAPISSPLRFTHNVQDFLASVIEESQPIESDWNQYESQDHHQSTIKVNLFTQGGQELRAQFEAKVRCDSQLRLCKYSSEIERSAVPEYDSNPWKICMESEYLFPQNPYSLSQLSGKKIVGSLKTTWGRNCNNANHVTIRAVAQQSQHYQQWLQQEPDFQYYSQSQQCQSQPQRCSPVQQYETLVKASRLNQYQLEAEWANLSPIVQNYTQKAFRAIRTALYWNSQVNSQDVQNPRNQLKVRFDLNPETRQYLNVTVQTPRERTAFRDLPLPMPVRPMNLQRPSLRYSSVSEVYQSFANQGAPVCQIHSRGIRTFDQVRYRAPISTCWSVLAKDCRQKSFAVLMRKMSQSSSQKMVKIISQDHKIVLEPQSVSQYENIKVTVNGEQIQVSQESQTFRAHGHEVARVAQTNNYLKVSLPEQGIRVYFDGYDANIKISPMYKNTQCGLCGHYDGEQDTEFFGPENEEIQDIRQFFQQYTIKSSSCQYPQQLSEICPSQRCHYQQASYENSWESEESQESSQEQDSSSESQEQSSEYQSRQQRQPVQRTQVIEQNSKICFSKAPIAVCPHNYYPSSHQQPQKVSYACLSRDDLDVDQLLRQIRVEYQSPARVSQLPTAFSENQRQPQHCDRF